LEINKTAERMKGQMKLLSEFTKIKVEHSQNEKMCHSYNASKCQEFNERGKIIINNYFERINLVRKLEGKGVIDIIEQLETYHISAIHDLKAQLEKFTFELSEAQGLSKRE